MVDKKFARVTVRVGIVIAFDPGKYTTSDVADDVMDSLQEVMPGITGPIEDSNSMEFDYAFFENTGQTW